jgi:hypothetical protein
MGSLEGCPNLSDHVENGRFFRPSLALDGNLVEYFRMNDVDFRKYKQAGNQLICDADELGVFL